MRVIAFVPDLMFGSKVVAMAERVELPVALCSTDEQLREQLAAGDLLVLDLSDEVERRLEIYASLGGRMRATIAFYSHVESETKNKAQSAGIELVVPRSRMAREGAELIRSFYDRSTS